MIQLTSFKLEEINELSRYIEAQVPNTFLQRTYVLTENPLDKSINFITIYRILESCKNYTNDKTLKFKLNLLLKECFDIYNALYPLTTKHEGLKIEFGKGRIIEGIRTIVFEPSNNEKISKLINAFLVFGEKIELNNIDSVMGIDLENDHGKEAIKEVRKVIEQEKI